MLEDDPDFRRLLMITLAQLGIDVRPARDLDHAREHLRDGVDLVILDFYVPPFVGTDLIDDIPDDVPIILVTGSIEPMQIKAKHPRISAVLRKPFKVAELEATVRTLLAPEG